MTWKKWLLIAVSAAALLGVVGPFVYIRFIEGPAPERLSLSTSAPSSGGREGTEGTWKVASGSQVGYRIEEVLFGQNNTAVGRTSDVEGSLEVSGTTIGSGSFTADMTTVTSDKERRDAQFQGRIMETSTYPTATFKLTKQIVFDSVPADGETLTKSATGDLTLHGTTKRVTFDVRFKRTGGTAQVNGSVPVTFAEYNIGSPSFGPVTTEDHGLLEFTLNLEHT
jgi:polyisoprenoid-binding protein YceI